MCLSVVPQGAEDGAGISEARTCNYIIYACTKSLQLERLSAGNWGQALDTEPRNPAVPRHELAALGEV